MISFIVTGFGPFRGVQENPTTILVQHLVPYLQSVHEPRTDQGNDGLRSEDEASLAQRTRTMIIETSSIAAKQQIDALYDELHREMEHRRRATDNEDDWKDDRTILLHLGVHSGSQQYRLESCAYNEASFSLPDEAGYQPWNLRIVHNSTLGTPLPTLLDLPDIVHQLNNNHRPEQQQLERQVPAIVSTDPGRFVCNYTYCYSLDKFQCSSNRSIGSVCDNNNDKGAVVVPNVRCLFLHVPPFSVASEAEQLRFIVDLMKTLERQVQKLT
jgi:pyroglutamyl-peptidase